MWVFKPKKGLNEDVMKEQENYSKEYMDNCKVKFNSKLNRLK